MTDPGFAYLRPTTLGDAVALMAGGNAAALAGGTDLVMMRASGQTTPRVIDVKHVTGLTDVTRDAHTIRIGSATPLCRVTELRGIGMDALCDGAAIVGSSQTRHRATLGGNVCRSSPAGDTLPGLLVLDADLVLVSRVRSRTMAARDFFTGPGANACTADELLTEIRIRVMPGASAYKRHTYRAWMDLAIVGVAVRLRLEHGLCQEATVAVGGAAPTPLLVPEAAAALRGRRPLEAASDAGSALARAARPITDVRGDAEYRRDILASVTRRVVAEAAQRHDEPLAMRASETTQRKDR